MKFKDLKENKTFRNIFKVVVFIVILLVLSIILRLINLYPINQYQNQFERNEDGIIKGSEPIYLEGNNNKAVILIHGLTDSPANFKHLAYFLNERGYSVYVPLLPGHGTKVQDLNDKRYYEWYRAAQNALEDVDEKERYIIGHSLGGLLALDIASRNEVEAVVTINAAVKLETRYAPFIPFVKLIEDYHIKSEEDINLLLDNNLSVPYNAMPLNSVSQLLKGVSDLKMDNIEEPIYIIQGIDDDVVDRDSAIEIYDKVSSKKKELVFIEDSSHEIINNAEEYYYTILNFFSPS